MNGPVSGTGEEAVWERPWSLEEIRRSSHSWSLGADAGLLNFLKEFSQQTISRTHEIEKQLDGLVREVKATDCRLHNVFNDFLMLSNTQFIENRVYDEEVEEHIVKPEQGDKPEQERTREQKEAELIPKIQEAVNYGLQVLESAFEQLDIKAGNSDSEDEEVNERVDLILEPKDLYIDRPLPYLIGSQSFMQQEDVGLGDLSSEEGSVDIDRGSVLDSEEEEEEEEEKDEEESDEDFGNNSEEEKKLHTNLSDEDEDNGSDLFGESDKEDEEENDKSAKTRTKSFADELAARIQAEIPKRLEADESSISSSEVKTKKEKEKKEVRKLPSDDEEDDMFKPPKLTDEDFFGNKGGLFSGGKGLFDDDDDEEGDLFSDLQTKERKPTEPAPVAKPETLPSNAKKKPPYGGVSLFPGGENVINPSILVDKDKRKTATPTEVAPKPVTNTSLFDDDVMFGGSAPAQPTAKAKPAADLFADDDDLFNDRPSMPPATVTKNKVAADLDKKNIQIPTEKPQPPEPSNKRLAKGLFSDEDDSESDLFSPSQTASKPKAATSAAPASKTSKALSLFDDEDEDLFGAAPESKPMPATTKPTQQPVLPTASKTQKSTLFNSVEEEPIKVPNDTKPVEKNKTDFSVPPKSKKEEKTEKKSSLFGDKEEDDLFAITKDSQKKHQRVSLLFEDDENHEEPLFPSAGSSTKSTGQTLEQSKTPVKVDTEKVSLFDDVHKKPESKAPVPVFEATVPPAVQKNNTVKSVSVKESDDLFADTPPTLKHTKPKSTNVLSLFGHGDDEDMEDQLSTSASSKESERVSTEKSTQARSTRVFQDEELLFSQELQKDNDPDVDLFASTSKKSTEKPSAAKPPDGLGLFGDEDEDDLFSDVKPPVITPKEKKMVIKKDSLDPSKEPSSLNVIKETIVRAEGGEKPTVPPPVKSKSPSTRIGKLQANLHINPAALLPGAVPKLSGLRHTVPEADISGLPVAESSQSLDVGRKSVEGVTFETPAQVDTLHSANKSRAKVTGKRRPPTRMGRKPASQDSGEAGDVSDSSAISPTQDTLSEATLAQSNWQLDKEEPIPSMKLSFSENDVQSRTKPKAPVNPLTPDVKDLFGSDLFGSSSLPDPVTSRQKEKLPVNEALSQPREEVNKPSASVFDADGSDDDLFKSVKEKHKKTFKPTSLLDDEPDDDLFGAQKPQKKVDVQPVPPKNIKTTADIFEDDIFAAEAIKPQKKPKEKKSASEANLFDDNSDIFADLTHKPKEKKSKKKVEAKSIFDDDMDDIFSTSASSTKKSKPKAKSTPPTSETKQDTKVSSMFDDPLNVLGK